jgi:hypothetical protein
MLAYSHLRLNLTKVRLGLLVSFSLLMILQILIGFKYFEDYLVVFIFTLFLNDLYFKIKWPCLVGNSYEVVKKSLMSVVFFILLMLPFIFDSLNISNGARLVFYKLGFVLWAQVFLIDSFLHYRETHSKRWLAITNLAVFLIVLSAFVY